MPDSRPKQIPDRFADRDDRSYPFTTKKLPAKVRQTAASLTLVTGSLKQPVEQNHKGRSCVEQNGRHGCGKAFDCQHIENKGAPSCCNPIENVKGNFLSFYFPESSRNDYPCQKQKRGKIRTHCSGIQRIASHAVAECTEHRESSPEGCTSHDIKKTGYSFLFRLFLQLFHNQLLFSAANPACFETAKRHFLPRPLEGNASLHYPQSAECLRLKKLLCRCLGLCFFRCGFCLCGSFRLSLALSFGCLFFRSI